MLANSYKANFISTTLNMRTNGMSLHKLPLFVWANQVGLSNKAMQVANVRTVKYSV